MVRMSAPSAWIAKARHERPARPSIITVQQPHTPCSQPTWVPVSPNSWRMKSLSSMRGLTCRVTGSPLTVTVTGRLGSDEAAGIGVARSVRAIVSVLRPLGRPGRPCA